MDSRRVSTPGCGAVNRAHRLLRPRLLDDFEVSAFPRCVNCVARMHMRIGRPVGIVREDHPLPRLSGINAKHRTHRNPNIEWYAGEACTKTDCFIRQLEIMSRGLTDIQNDLAIFDMLARHADSVDAGIDNDVGCVAIVTHPLVHRADQVGPFRSAWIRHFCYKPGFARLQAYHPLRSLQQK